MSLSPFHTAALKPAQAHRSGWLQPAWYRDVHPARPAYSGKGALFFKQRQSTRILPALSSAMRGDWASAVAGTQQSRLLCCRCPLWLNWRSQKFSPREGQW